MAKSSKEPKSSKEQKLFKKEAKKRLGKIQQEKLKRSFLSVESNINNFEKGIKVLVPLALFRKGIVKLPIKSVDGLKIGDFVVYQGNKDKNNRVLRSAAKLAEIHLQKGERYQIIEIKISAGEILISPAI